MSSENFLSKSNNESEDGDVGSTLPAGRWKVLLPSLVVLLLAISLCMSAASLFLTRMVAHRVTELEVGVDGVGMLSNLDQGLCLPCDDLEPERKSGGSGLTRYFDDETGREMCCAKNEEQASGMLILFVEKRLYKEEARAGSCPDALKVTLSNNGSTCLIKRPQSSVAAHIAGVPPKSGSKSEIITDWTEIREDTSAQVPSFLRNVKAKAGRLTIAEAGLYFIYSQIYFFQTSLQPSIRHYISRNGRVNDELLFEHSKTRCSGMSACEHTSYVAGVVQLAAYDELYVGVSNRSNVHHDPKTTYFGLYKL